MNGGHDLGGMHGLGPIDPEPESKEPVFHTEWEPILEQLRERNLLCWLQNSGSLHYLLDNNDSLSFVIKRQRLIYKVARNLLGISKSPAIISGTLTSVTRAMPP